MRSPRNPSLHPEIELGPPLTVQALDPLRELVSPEPGDPKRVAILVCHGMGQQVRFQTLMDLARALERGRGRRVGPVQARPLRVRQGETTLDLHRAELVLESNGTVREVHLYEAYWAPLTEGKVNLRDVISFLTTGAIHGWLHASGPSFRRWMFGRPIDLLISRTSTRRRLGAAWGVIMGVLATNLVIGVTGLVRLLRGGDHAWPSDAALVVLAKEVLLLVGLLLVSGLSIVGIGTRRALDPMRRTPPWMIGTAWVLLVLGLAATVAVPVAMIIELVLPIASVPAARPLPPAVWLGMVALWGVLLGTSAFLRWLIVEYVGDVAAYISSHAVNKFSEVREAIQKLSYGMGRAIYSAMNENGAAFEYGRVIVVGHSLGSVVAYDTLNACIREDLAAAGRLRVANRTRMLLTFGSPLNKTAFLYRTQMPEGSELREALAATVQPMIQSYDLRPGEWINIYSRSDWISGPLQYYDDPDDLEPEHVAKKVRDVIDPAATTPLVAHTEYWRNQELADQLAAGVFEEPKQRP